MAQPDRVADWIRHLSADMRSCQLLGYYCVATFDITPESIAPLAEKILDALAIAEIRCSDIDIGLYGPDDVRVWCVTRGI